MLSCLGESEKQTEDQKTVRHGRIRLRRTPADDARDGQTEDHGPQTIDHRILSTPVDPVDWRPEKRDLKRLMEENLYTEPFKTDWLRVKDYLHGPASCNLYSVSASSAC